MQKQEESEKLITYDCKKCLKKIEFKIPSKIIEEDNFPIKLSNTHGEPKHQLIITVNKKLDVESFEINEKIDKIEGSKTSRFTEEVLKDYGLTQNEIKLHIMCSGLGPVTVGEMSRIADIDVDEVEKIAQKFVEKGFFREIVGAKKYYQALPPYPALINQLTEFGNFITDIKKETPEKLQSSFSSFESQAEGVKNLKEYVTYLRKLSGDISKQLDEEKEILDENLKKLDQQESIDAINQLQKESTELMVTQFEALDLQVLSAIDSFDEKFNVMSNRLDNSVKGLTEKLDTLTARFATIQDRISKNLKKLRLGVIQKAVDEVIGIVVGNEITELKSAFKSQIVDDFEKLVSKLKESFSEEFKVPITTILRQSQANIKEAFEDPFNQLISEVSSKINETAEEASKIGESIKGTFNSIMNQFDQTLEDAEKKVSGISDKVLESFQLLRTTFSKTVIQELEDMLSKVTDKLALSSLTVEEFWEDAKTSITQTMKDVWFIRTPAGMKSQINEEIARAKMRILIVAPTILDIELEPILQTKRKINVRLSCSVDPNNPKHKEVLKKLEEKTNVTIRDRELQNLWGVNKDYEEILLGIVSKISDQEGDYELVGLGSSLQEHIKILVPILEEAWMGSKKDFKPIDSTIKRKSQKSVSSNTSEQKPSISAEEKVITDKMSAPSSPKSIATTPQSVSATPQQKEVDPDIINNILGKIEAIRSHLSNASPKDLSGEMTNLRDYIFENKGFSKILTDIRNWATQLKNKNKLDDTMVKMLNNKLDNWKENVQN